MSCCMTFCNCSDQYNGHEYVDLGLSVKWATCNVGANSPEEYGGYYAWGETEEKDYYDWSTYKWCEGKFNTQTKYCTNEKYGTFDNKETLSATDDVVCVKWGGSWRMPTQAEQDELCERCKWTWTTQNGVNGYKVVGPNGNSIFLPAAGVRDEAGLYTAGSDGYYWSSTLYESEQSHAYYINFDSRDLLRLVYGRSHGISVRPVCP